MNNAFHLSFMSLLVLASCKKSDLPPDRLPVAEEQSFIEPIGRQCASYEMLQQQLKDDPELLGRMEKIERVTEAFLNEPRQQTLLATGEILIPVVVNVLYKTAAENISLTQIQSQIDVLNEDYGALNADYNLTGTYQSVKSGNTKIKFRLDTVIRKSTTKTSWTTDNAVKKSSGGGLNPTSPTTKLNLWVCTLSAGLLGYAQFPGGLAATDGVVITNKAFGRVGTLYTNFNKGRTATHEIGHWLNLKHIWGDATCGTDLVADTPPHDAANYGCPSAGQLSACPGTPIEMNMNYMDYTDDKCMYMFTLGQSARMQANFVVGGARASFR